MALVGVESVGKVAVVRMQNGVTNAMNPTMLAELTDTMRNVRKEYAGVVVTGGDKFFSIGFELPVVLQFDRATMSEFFLGFNALLLEFFTLPLPTATAARGHAVGAGSILFLASDYRFARKGRTLIGLHGIKLGIPMPYLTDMILRQLAGDVFASDMLYRGALVEAAEAQVKGIVHEVLPAESVEERAVERVAELTGLVPSAYRVAKANRVEIIKNRYEENGRARNEEFLDIWFSPRTQGLLREAASRF